jgi:hypothetical protein
MGDRSESLEKLQATAGTVAFLRENAHEIDEAAFRASKLHQGALGHPVLIVDALTQDHPYVWVCVVGAYERSSALADKIS